jgi:hypothetical protein
MTKKKDKRINNNLQSITQKTKDCATWTPLKIGSEFRCSGSEKQNDNYITMYHMHLINVSECGDMSISGVLFQWASTVDIQLSVFNAFCINQQAFSNQSKIEWY